MTVKEAKAVVKLWEDQGGDNLMEISQYARCKSFLDYHKRVQPVIEAQRAMMEFLKQPMNSRAEDDLKEIILSLNKALAQYEKDVIGEWEGK